MQNCESDDSGVIQQRIIQNLYTNDIVICDVSCKNPNVMFELGMRLAFDKATIIIKDDITDFSFDTSIIEHLIYPRDLRFNKILSFKESLSHKIQGTYEKSRDTNYSTFLKSFGDYKVAKLNEKTVSKQDYIIDKLNTMDNRLRYLDKAITNYSLNLPDNILNKKTYSVKDFYLDEIKTAIRSFIQATKINPNDLLKEDNLTNFTEYLKRNSFKINNDLHSIIFKIINDKYLY
jgi:hypothetical protein